MERERKERELKKKKEEEDSLTLEQTREQVNNARWTITGPDNTQARSTQSNLILVDIPVDVLIYEIT